ncbi:TPA: hypothetical protein EYP66_19890 [Candidatus Poribacteria bacterium]|nr:hypothetical protein [Candidatus Poribacteria bacterium]
MKDWHTREDRIETKLAARYYRKLFPLLKALKGTVLNHRYCIRWPYDIGGQGILLIADDLSQAREVLIKFAALPYHRPADISLVDIQHSRRFIEKEAELLKMFQGTLLPELYDFFYASNPLHAQERGSEITLTEPYFVMELLNGCSLDTHVRQLRSEKPVDYGVIERWLVLTLEEIMQFFTMLFDNGFLYTDPQPANIFVCEGSERCIRIVDAGSIVAVEPMEPPIFPFSEVYLSPENYQRFTTDKLSYPDQQFVIYALGKALFGVATNREPIPGEDPNFGEEILQSYSVPFVHLLHGMIEKQYESFKSVYQAENLLKEVINYSL